MIGRHWVACICLATTVVAAHGADDVTPDKAPATKAADKVKPPLRLDLARRRIVLDAVVAQRADSLEFVLCTRGTKDYESLLATPVSPSMLHAALLALDLRPGKPGRWSDPKGKEPVFLPPVGAGLSLTVRWIDAKGARHEAPVADWLIEASAQARPKAISWVFVGSAILDDGSYWADREGHHISLANFASSVIDVPFSSSAKTAMLEFAPNPKVVPPKGTPVELVIVPLPGGEKAPDARVTFTVDSLGRIEMDGRAMMPERIGKAVKEFLARHSRGAAEVIVHPRAMAFDRQRIADILADAGMAEVSFRTGELTVEVLPRTAGGAARAIAWWRKQFAAAGEQLLDPAEDARAVLAHIRTRQQQVEALGALWGDYAAQLKALVKKHQERKDRSGDGNGQNQP